jgi:hypothetical protein
MGSCHIHKFGDLPNQLVIHPMWVPHGFVHVSLNPWVVPLREIHLPSHYIIVKFSIVFITIIYLIEVAI